MFVSRACILVSLAVPSLGARKKSVKRDHLQRSDDLMTAAEIAQQSTEHGCVCNTACKTSTLSDCDAQLFCYVDADSCTKGSAMHSFLSGDWDYCTFSDPNVGQSAQTKKERLVSKFRKSTTPQDYFGGLTILHGVHHESMKVTMDSPTDVFPYAGRIKYVRPQGVVAPVKFVSKGGHPYTGVFKGADHGIVRLSLSQDPGSKDAFAPGVALKFLRDGRPSANIVGFTNFEGQPCSETNFFAHAMYTNVPSASGLSALVPWKFQQVTGCTQMVGLSEAASDESGQSVFPFDLSMKGIPVADFGCKDGPMGWANLEKIPAGTELLSVKAKAAPGEAWQEIGVVVLEDSLTLSEFGDKELFFQHQRKEEDFAKHPEWLASVDLEKECGNAKMSTTPPKIEDGCSNLR